MTQNGQASEGLQVALLTVHLEQPMVEQIRQCASEMDWALAHVDYTNYFSLSKLPPLTQRAIDAQGCIAVIDFDGDPERALETAECLRQSFFHKIAILALSSTTDPDLLLRAMRAGFGGFLGKPLDVEEFLDTLSRLDHRWAVNVARPMNAGKILSFFGAKGAAEPPPWLSTWPCSW